MKKITDAQRLEEIFGRASLPEAQGYLAICGAILRARFPQAVKVKATNHRKPRIKELAKDGSLVDLRTIGGA